MVPTLTWGLSRSNLAFATLVLLLLLSECFVRPQDEPNQDISFPSETAATRRQRNSRCRLGGFLLSPADPLGNVRGHFLVAVELHRVRGAALGRGPHVRGVAEHLGERHMGGDDLSVTTLLHAVDL